MKMRRVKNKMEYIYGALLLHKLGQAISETSLSKVVESTGVPVDNAKVKTLIASLQGVDISAELENASVAISSGGASSGISSEGDGKEEKVEKKQEEKKEESAAGLASLFG
jgi:large subunit ribosomal protein L12